MVLTPREKEIAAMIADGLSGPEVAERVGVKHTTVRHYMWRAYRKLGLESHTTKRRGRDQQRIKLAVYWNCELFQVGLNAA